MSPVPPPGERPIIVGDQPGIVSDEQPIHVADDPSAFDLPLKEKSSDGVTEELIKTFSILSLSIGGLLGLIFALVCPPLGIALLAVTIVTAGAASIPYGVIKGLKTDEEGAKEVLKEIGKEIFGDFANRFLPNLCHQTLLGNVALALGNGALGLVALAKNEKEKMRKLDEWINGGRKGPCPGLDDKLNYQFGASGKNVGGIPGFKMG